MSNTSLFTIVVLIWGSTWLAITFQFGEIDPILSVGLRFSFAAVILGTYCFFKKLSLRLPLHIHFKMALAGLCLYALDYTMLYQSQQYIISAIVAVMSSCMVYINVVLRRVLLKKPMRSEVIVGATCGLVGIGLIFKPEFALISADRLLLLGIGFAFVSFFFAGLGNVISERILDHGTPVIQMNFWAMSYGVLCIFAFAFSQDIVWSIPRNPHYYFSMLYLSLFGSVLAFGAYMKLLRQMGSDKAAYVVLVYPIVALILSTFFEGYQWHIESVFGVCIVLFGNAIAMGKIPLPMLHSKLS
ncbi:MAG: DMT family transporter [Paraglaciecola sp.]|uniref:DMT family transporter n=1 Tax=Pseudomonadati TaxID=3379134 RepID=UPI00273DA734|nr:DMT family transporter [Paraglaciecola sp.]MDP5030795.1 DMT family transporter [Paraglaciecola sp.]MDP5132141.1 DMT family transporter [Paraglaciecola sp.]